jgi:hypothetical protein
VRVCSLVFCYCHSVSLKCLVHVETALRWVRVHSCEMDGLCCSQRSPHSRLVAHSGPVRLFCFFFPPLIFGTGFGGDVACDYFWLSSYVFGSCGFSEVTSNLVDGDAIS